MRADGLLRGQGEFADTDLQDGAVDVARYRGTQKCDRAGDFGSGPRPQIAIADGFEPGQQAGRRSTHGRVRHKLARALAERGAVRVAIYESLQDLCESNARVARRLDDRGIGLGGGELRIAGVQVSDPAGEALFP